MVQALEGRCRLLVDGPVRCLTIQTLYRTARRCGSPCGAPCTSRSIRRRMCSKTRSACGWRPRTTAGAAVRTWTRRFTSRFRASIVARARFIEDLVVEQAGRGVGQYVILGAGLDSFAQRRPEIASGLRIFEVDRPGPQAWKRQRLIELGFGIPEWLRLVPVDFEAAAGPGGSGWRPPASIPPSPRSWPPPASACTSPRTRSRPPCARSRRSPRDPRSP